MNTFYAGEPVLIEEEVERQLPFSNSEYYDPNPVPTVTVTDPAGTVKVTAQAMSRYAAGQFYYVVQTATNWVKGNYIVTTTWNDGTYQGLSRSVLFKLV